MRAVAIWVRRLVTIPENTANPGNGYFVDRGQRLEHLWLQITTATTNQSGLAIDDVQTAPEPSSFLLLATGPSWSADSA